MRFLTLPRIFDYGPCLLLILSWQKCSSRKPSRWGLPFNRLSLQQWRYLGCELDANTILRVSVDNFWSADVHGLDGMLPALPATALGRVPEQVLQGRRVQVRASIL